MAALLEDTVYAVRVLQLKADPVDGKDVLFEAKGRALITPGWKTLVQKDDSEDEEAEPENSVPALKPGTPLTAQECKLLPQKTKPPTRYTEATLIKRLEALGIGRPSTYAAILDNIKTREYIKEEKRQLLPSSLGEKVVDALQGGFSFVEYNFTKELESSLDKIAEGKADYKSVISEAYQILKQETGKVAAENLHPCPDCGQPMRHRVKKGSYDFWGCTAYPDCKTTCADNNGRPGPKQEPKAPVEHSEHNCKECGKPLIRRRGTSAKTAKDYNFFACSGFPECKKSYDVKNDKPIT